MPVYIHELDNWPQFFWDEAVIGPLLAGVSRQQGRLVGRMESLGFDLRNEAVLETLTEDVHKSSEIEGEVLDKDQVRSSVARRLGLDIGGLLPSDRNVGGVVEMMLDATQRFDAPLDDERLFGWHAALFPTGRSGMAKITVGDWRSDAKGPMQVISGPIGKEKVHYQAIEASSLKSEMETFLNWFEGERPADLVLKAGLAHLWFVTIHPMDDGNGRIARAIADMALARSENSAQRFYSMSGQIRKERKAYYDVLERTQKGDLDVTEWLIWFLNCLQNAFAGAEETLASILAKAEFWERLKGQTISERQQLVLNKLLDGFEGKLTSSKWAKLTKTSPDTALRDITDLVERGILEKDAGGGRSTSYSIAMLADDN
jgi:Fic family protein